MVVAAELSSSSSSSSPTPDVAAAAADEVVVVEGRSCLGWPRATRCFDRGASWLRRILKPAPMTSIAEAIAPPTTSNLVVVDDRAHQELEGGGDLHPKISDFSSASGW